MIGPGRFHYWTYPSSVGEGTVAAVPRLALQAVLPLRPRDDNRAVTNRYDVNFFRAVFRPRAVSVDTHTHLTRTSTQRQLLYDRHLHWTTLTDCYTFSFTLGIAGDPIQGRHHAGTLRLPSDVTVAEFFAATAHFLGVLPVTISLLYEAPWPLNIQPQLINAARLGHGAGRRQTALPLTTLAGFFFTNYSPLLQVVFHAGPDH